MKKMQSSKRKKKLKIIKNNMQFLLLCLPTIIGFLMFKYIPMAGLIMAFEKYTYKDGLFGSKWVGLKNFELFVISADMRGIILRTLLYSLWFLILGLFMKSFFALLLAEISSRKALKFFQTCITLPNFLSWVVVGFITYSLLHPTLGILNQFLEGIGVNTVDVYSDAKYWPLILTIVNQWKGVGMGSIVYYAALMGIDPSLYEAAAMDGANRWKQVWHISIPHLVPLICIYGILGMGDLFDGGFGLFYQIPRNIPTLYETTDILDTYIFRSLQGGSYGISSAMNFMQSFMGFVLVVAANWVVKKISPENSMF